MGRTVRASRTLLIVRLVFASLALGLLKHVVPLRRLARWAWRAPARTPAAIPTTELVGRVLQAGRISGTPDRDCVQRSLLLYRELSKAGLDPTLTVGVRRDPDRVRGHAWVEVHGRVVTESAAELGRFTPIVRFGREGAVIPDRPATQEASAPARP